MTIHDEIEAGKFGAVQKMLCDDPLLVNSKSKSNDQPLHIAAWQRKTKIVELLLNAGADVDARGWQSRTPLHYAVDSDSKPIVQMLLGKEANARLVDDSGATPVYLAASTENTKLMGVFAKLGTPIDLASAIYVDGPQAVLARLEADSDSLKATPHFTNLLWDATRIQSLDLIRFLLSHGVELNRKIFGTYPLLDAISYNNEEIVKLFLANGADVSVKDHADRSLLKFSEIYGASPAIICLLKARGAS